MSNSLISITCKVCKHEWHEDVERLKQMRESMYKALYRVKADYRVACPKCGTVNIVTVSEEADDDQVRR